MTKNFCDICGQPATEFWPGEIHQLEDQTWSGSKSSGISYTDGTYTPTFNFHFVVRVENLNKSNPNEHPPDLCAGCTIMLLEKLVTKLKGKA